MGVVSQHKEVSSDDSEKIIGKRIILVDDIFTTGTTVNEISKKLKI